MQSTNALEDVQTPLILQQTILGRVAAMRPDLERLIDGLVFDDLKNSHSLIAAYWRILQNLLYCCFSVPPSLHRFGERICKF